MLQNSVLLYSSYALAIVVIILSVIVLSMLEMKLSNVNVIVLSMLEMQLSNVNVIEIFISGDSLSCL